MSETPQSKPKNYRRRSVGVVVCFAPLVVPIVSLVAGLAGNGAENFSGIWIMIPAALLAGLNFYRTFLRGWVFYRRHGTIEGYQHVSVIPGIGSLLILLGSVFSFGAIGNAVLGIVAVAFDTGGLPWFLFATWNDSSFWD